MAATSLGRAKASAIVSSGARAPAPGSSRLATMRSTSPENSAAPEMTSVFVRSSAAKSGVATTMPCCESVRPRAAKICASVVASSFARACFSGRSRISGAIARSSRSVNAMKRSANAIASADPTTVIAFDPFSVRTRMRDGSNETSSPAAKPGMSPASVTASERSRAPPAGPVTARSASATRSAPALRRT
ncbi:MAG: hypothetical protein LW806_03245 [Planctomycetaceae bacterium]|nr:hypothetical protein [Planctomycetaceae bacterium]